MIGLRLGETVSDEQFVYVYGLGTGAEPAGVAGVVQGGAQRHAQRGVRHQHAREPRTAVHYVFTSDEQINSSKIIFCLDQEIRG